MFLWCTLIYWIGCLDHGSGLVLISWRWAGSETMACYETLLHRTTDIGADPLETGCVVADWICLSECRALARMVMLFQLPYSFVTGWVTVDFVKNNSYPGSYSGSFTFNMEAALFFLNFGTHLKTQGVTSQKTVTVIATAMGISHPTKSLIYLSLCTLITYARFKCNSVYRTPLLCSKFLILIPETSETDKAVITSCLCYKLHSIILKVYSVFSSLISRVFFCQDKDSLWEGFIDTWYNFFDRHQCKDGYEWEAWKARGGWNYWS
jgi:hypothetical protein